MEFLNYFLNLFNIKFMKSSTTMKIIQSHAIMNFILAFENLPTGHILRQVFGHDEKLLNHIVIKVEGTDGSIISLMKKLDATSRESIIRWVMENYKGIDVTNVAAYYCDPKDKSKRLDCLVENIHNKTSI